MSSSATKPMVWYGCVCGLMDSMHTRKTHTIASVHIVKSVYGVKILCITDKCICSYTGKQTFLGIYMCTNLRNLAHKHIDTQIEKQTNTY